MGDKKKVSLSMADLGLSSNSFIFFSGLLYLVLARPTTVPLELLE